MANILVIGATSGIGAALVGLAQSEDIQLFSISRHRVANVYAHFQCDVLHDPLPKIDAHLDGLIYCPGSINLKPFSSIKLNDFILDFELNVLGAVRCLQFYHSHLLAAKLASVVLCSTVAVQTGFPYHALVAVSKGGIEGLTRTLAAEWAPNIRVNAIAPSLTHTPLSERLLRDTDKKHAAALRHPLKRVGEADDLANMVLFLLSDKASWVTGQIIHIDGGISTLKT